MPSRVPILRNQLTFLPDLLEEKVEQGPHAARFYLYLADILNLNLKKVSPLGAPPYCRHTALASIFYAMHHGHFESEQIVKFIGDSIGAHWILSGMTIPSYKTIERVVNDLLGEVENLFIQILNLCDGFDLIGRERTFVDGTKKQANASKHKAMSYEYLNKKIDSGAEALKVLFKELRSIMDGIEDLTDDEFDSLVLRDAKITRTELRRSHKQDLTERQEQIFNIDIESEESVKKDRAIEKLKNELESMSTIEPENQDKALEMLNDTAFISNRVDRMIDAKDLLETKWKEKHGDKKISDKCQINFTDPDSAIMQTKHHGIQQCYNHFAIVDAKANIILGSYTSSSSSDQLGLIPVIKNVGRIFGSLEGIILVGDAGFFSAANILYCLENGIDFYASYPEAKSPYAKDKFEYDRQKDVYICPKGSVLSVERQSKDLEKSKYSNEDACRSCSHSKDCTKAKDGIRRIERHMVDDMLREDAKEKAQSETGKEVLKQRKSVPEPVFGNMKTQDKFTQMHFRGTDKVSAEFDLHCVFQNIRKLYKVYMNSSSFQETVHRSENYQALA